MSKQLATEERCRIQDWTNRAQNVKAFIYFLKEFWRGTVSFYVVCFPPCLQVWLKQYETFQPLGTWDGVNLVFLALMCVFPSAVENALPYTSRWSPSSRILLLHVLAQWLCHGDMGDGPVLQHLDIMEQKYRSYKTPPKKNSIICRVIIQDKIPRVWLFSDPL